MKKNFLFVTVLILSMLLASCSQKEEKVAEEATASEESVENKEDIEKQASPEISAMRTAFNLAAYGYEVSSPSALIEAANILASIPVQKLETEAEANNASAENKGEKVDKKNFSAENLIADAKEMAADDATLMAMIEKVESKISAQAEEARGAVGGPKYAYGRVYARDYTLYQQKFWANEVAEIAVAGDGDTDIDLYVYDGNGNLITSDADYTGECYVRWMPRWTGVFTLKIVNRGYVYNNYVIVTN